MCIIAAPLPEADPTQCANGATLQEFSQDKNGVRSFVDTFSASRDAEYTVSFTETRIGFGRTPEGLAFERLRRSETLNGKHGTFLLRSTERRFHIGVIDEDDYSATSTWTIAKATGRYARLTGSGGGAGILRAITPHSRVHVYSYRYEGRLAKP